MNMYKRIVLSMMVSFLTLLLIYIPVTAMSRHTAVTSAASRAAAVSPGAWRQTAPLTATHSATATNALTVTHLVTPDLQIPCTVNVLRLNLRSGPGTQYNVLDAMAKNMPFTATERLADNSWLAGNSPQQQGWTAARFVTCTAPVTELRIATAFAQPVSPPAAVTTSTVASTAGATAAAPAAVQPVSTGTFRLLQPLTERLHGRQTFQWQPGITLQPNQAFEVVFWQPGQDPLAQSFGLVQTKTESGTTVDLDKLSTILPQLQWGKEYQWGILLVQARPYRRLQYIGGGQPFLFAVDPADPADKNKDGKPDELAAPPKAPPK